MPAYVDIGDPPGQLRFTALAYGADGNGITVQYADDPGAVTVDVTGSDILITLTDGGISGLDIIAAVEADEAASALVIASVTPENPYAPVTNDGSGLSSSLDAATPQVLAGGVPRLPVFSVGPRGALNVLSLSPVTGAPVVTVYNADGDLMMYLRDDGAAWFAGGRVQVSPGGATQVNIDGTAGEPDGSELFILQVDGTPQFTAQPGGGQAFTMNGRVATDILLTLSAFVAQSANLLEVKDDTALIASRFDKRGGFVTAATSAPADGDLAAGEIALWVDPTNGATKLKLKGKSTNGTVVVGEVALT